MRFLPLLLLTAAGAEPVEIEMDVLIQMRQLIESQATDLEAAQTKAADMEEARDRMRQLNEKQSRSLDGLTAELGDVRLAADRVSGQLGSYARIIDQLNTRVEQLTVRSRDQATANVELQARFRSVEDDRDEKQGKLWFWRVATSLLTAVSGFLAYLHLKPRFL